MWNTAVLALQEGSAVGCMIKESYVSVRQGEVSSHLQSIQTTSEASPASYLFPFQGNHLGQEAYHLPLSSARVKNMWNCTCCTSTPLYTLTVWCLMKHGDSFTLYGVCSC